MDDGNLIPMLHLTTFQVLLKQRVAVGPLSLRLRQGELLAITGPNGSGKSTLLRGLLGLLPTKGTIKYHGKQVDRLPPAAIGYVPQRFNFPGTLPLTVREFFELSAVNTPDAKLCTELKLHALMDRSLAVLSGGELQRVVLARALARNPELLILDEASAGIDVRGQAEILDLLLHLIDTHHGTIILVTHDVDELNHYRTKLGRKFHAYALGTHTH
ncbi:ATP-binding cassette domain-containing protein [Candidatus Berkelbacteria bacterium]|nr:ATP-binding cassette domain-containing protein [Candidatus Berkelbacteria bacterium]